MTDRATLSIVDLAALVSAQNETIQRDQSDPKLTVTADQPVAVSGTPEIVAAQTAFEASAAESLFRAAFNFAELMDLPFDKFYAERIAATDALSLSLGLALADAVVMSDQLLNVGRDRANFEDILLADNLALRAAFVRRFADAVGAVDSLSFMRAAQARLADAVAAGDKLALAVARARADAVVPADVARASVAPGRVEVATVADAMTLRTAFRRAFTDAAAVTDTPVLRAGKRFTDATSTADSFLPAWGKGAIDAIATTDALRFGFRPAPADDAYTLDAASLAVKYARKFADSVLMSDLMVRVNAGSVAQGDVAAITESFARLIGKASSDSFTLSDALRFATRPALSAAATVTDSGVLAFPPDYAVDYFAEDYSSSMTVTF